MDHSWNFEPLSSFVRPKLATVAPWEVCEEISIWRLCMHSDAFGRKCEKLKKSQMKRDLRGFVVRSWKGAQNFRNDLKFPKKDKAKQFESQKALINSGTSQVKPLIFQIFNDIWYFLLGHILQWAPESKKSFFCQKFFSIRKVHAKSFPTLGRTSLYDKTSQIS